MMTALVGGVKRAPRAKGERAVCPDCEAELLAVMPIDHAPHWRHRGGDCDPWGEPEGPWHLGWKQRFAEECREIKLVDERTGEWHRADVRCVRRDGSAVVLELQHSSIGEEERLSRDAFYGVGNRMFWLLHMHDEGSFRATSLRMSLTFGDVVVCRDKTFHRMTWFGRSTQFIERWKTSCAHVFLDIDGHLFYLATRAACADLVQDLKKGQFALSPLSAEQLVMAVAGITRPLSL